MKNKIFQFLWYKIVRKLFPVGNDLNGFYRNHRRIAAQLALARLFGAVHAVLLGDSEHGQFDNYAVMKKFDRLTLCLAIGGTTPRDLYDYFSGKGAGVYEQIKLVSIKKFISTGGNCSLKNQMNEIPEYLECVRALFPVSWIVLIPPVYTGVLSTLYNMAGVEKSENQIIFEINQVRGYQRSMWTPRIVDTYTPFVDPQTGGPLPGVLRDPVHFGKAVVDIIQKVYNRII